ncbi:MAG: hypothetical protein LBB85_13000 [Dysgonamonadaceae bacterium]|jgi:hypothetical protein|nr:hypothetical protein [Dysgonamonadaceae bacterium]
MENIQGGAIRYCVVGKWVSGRGVVALAEENDFLSKSNLLFCFNYGI